MEHVYPQETLGRTLYEEVTAGELRRVYARTHGSWLEIGEITRGPLTQELYFAPAHLHCVHIDYDQTTPENAIRFFEEGSPFLVDYMDELDALNIPYGYLNCEMGSHVSYRPAGMRKNGQEP